MAVVLKYCGKERRMSRHDVLAISPVFEKMLSSGFKEGETQQVDFEGETVEAYDHFFDLGEYPNTKDFAVLQTELDVPLIANLIAMYNSTRVLKLASDLMKMEARQSNGALTRQGLKNIFAIDKMCDIHWNDAVLRSIAKAVHSCGLQDERGEQERITDCVQLDCTRSSHSKQRLNGEWVYVYMDDGDVLRLADLKKHTIVDLAVLLKKNLPSAF